jgi:hypothetical protein
MLRSCPHITDHGDHSSRMKLAARNLRVAVSGLSFRKHLPTWPPSPLPAMGLQEPRLVPRAWKGDMVRGQFYGH